MTDPNIQTAAEERTVADWPSPVRLRFAARLGEISGLILANRLPMPPSTRPPMLNFDLGDDVAQVEKAAAALGVEVQQYGRRVQATWPPIHERGDGLPFASWHANRPIEVCEAHGEHPHDGRRCLDCPLCPTP